MREWMEKLVRRLQAAFGARLRFVGLQGSRARGEAAPESDIDAVVILDDVALEDLRAYRALLKTMPEREKVCGFFGGAAELARGRIAAALLGLALIALTVLAVEWKRKSVYALRVGSRTA